MPAIMFQGTGSNVGKSILVAGLCRAAFNRGINVAPFKPQNMSNNAAVTEDGGEIGRAQALQAMACNLPFHTDMNPILLKPETETGSQVIVQGHRHSTLKAREYDELKPQLIKPVLESFERLKAQYDVVLVEGAGSPAEINLRENDIANMGFAIAGNVPVILIGDIDRGGIIPQIVGTSNVLPKDDRQKVQGFIVNKFRGDKLLFDDGYKIIENQSGWPGFGVLNYFPDAWKLPAEDALDVQTMSTPGQLKIVCLCLSRMANFDDLDPLAQENDIELKMLKAGQAIPGDANLVLIPGSKSTRGDLKYLREQGWDIDLYAHYRRGGHILGLCGGYQMLGKQIDDPNGLDGPAGSTEGLGLLDVNTEMLPEKTLRKVTATHAETNLAVSGYEIHLGKTKGEDCKQPFAYLDKEPEGACSKDGRISGSYLHGLFSSDDFRSAFLEKLGAPSGGDLKYEKNLNDVLNKLANHIEDQLDVNALLKVAQ